MNGKDARMKRMGRAIKALRITCGLSSEDLAKELGVSRCTMSRIENDSENLSLLYYNALNYIFIEYGKWQSTVLWLYTVLVEVNDPLYEDAAKELIKRIEDYSLTLSRKNGSALAGWKMREEIESWRGNRKKASGE